MFYKFCGLNFINRIIRIFSLNVLETKENKHMLSIKKVMYNICLILFFSFNFYTGLIQQLPLRREYFTIKLFARWATIAMQMISPIVFIVINMLLYKKDVLRADTMELVTKSLYSLGYKGKEAEINYLKKMFLVVFLVCSTFWTIDIILVGYPFNNILKLQRLIQTLQFLICTGFEVTVQLNQAYNFHCLQRWFAFLNSAPEDVIIKQLPKRTTTCLLSKTIRVYSLLTQNLMDINTKYSFFVLFICFKTIIVIAPCLCEIFVEHFLVVLKTASFPVDDLAHTKITLLSVIWVVYEIGLLAWMIKVHVNVSLEVRVITIIIITIIIIATVNRQMVGITQGY